MVFTVSQSGSEGVGEHAEASLQGQHTPEKEAKKTTTKEKKKKAPLNN